VPVACRRRGIGALVLSCAAALLLSSAPAAAQTDPSPGGPSSLDLEVTDLDGLVTEEADLRIGTRISNGSRVDRPDLRLLVTVHRQPIGRFNYQQAMDRGVLGDIIHAFAVDAGEVPARGSRTVELTQTADELGLLRPAGQDGVYPLRVQLQSGGQVVDELITNLVYAPNSVELPISVSLLLPIAEPPSRDGHGVFVRDGLLEGTAPGGPLSGLVDALEDRPDLPVTLAVDALTLEETSDLASGFMRNAGDATEARASDSAEARHAADFLEALRTVAARPLVHVLALPYASADLVAMERHGLDRELSRHVSDGMRSVEARVDDRPIDTILWPPDGADARTLARLRGLGIRALVLTEDYLELPGPRGPRSPSPLRRLQGATTPAALVPDPWLGQTLVDSDLSTPLLAQRLLGEIATVYLEVPSIGERGVLLAPPLGEAVDPGLVATLADDLAAAPFADLVTLASLSQRVAPSDEWVRLAYPPTSRAAELPAGYLAGLREARRDLRSLDGVLVDDQVTPARFDQLLLQAGSIHYRDDLAAGRALLGAVSGTMHDLNEAVEIPDVPPVTLTSVEGQLPVTIRSRADVPLRVVLHLRTASYDIDGGPVRELVLEPGRAQVLTFDVRALRPGRTDGVQLLVTDVDGTVTLAESTVVVRSTTFSVAGLVVTLGAALFLLGWGVREAARRRRGPLQAEGVRADRPHEPTPRPSRAR
jgi:hypothetical protein